MTKLSESIHKTLHQGIVIPAHPLALTVNRTLDERRQRALSRYYIAAGAGGLAVGVHTTQFAIHDPRVGLYKPVLELAAEEMQRADQSRQEPMVRIGGIVGETDQAVREAAILNDLGFHAGLLSLTAMKGASLDRLVDHCRAVAEVVPVFGFYLQASIGGMKLPFEFWRRFAEIENVAAIKIAPFNRYHTIDVVRAVAEAGRDDIALYTGNDDNIVLDLLTPFRFVVNGKPVTRRIVGGLLGHWAVWTKTAVELLNRCHQITRTAEDSASVPAEMIQHNVEVTDANAVLFDAAHDFAGCIPGIHEVLRRQGLLEGTWCFDREEVLSAGQAAEIDRIYASYPHMVDDAFVKEYLDEWLR